MQCPECKGYRHAGECKTSDMDDYLAFKADAERKQAAYLAFLQEIPSVYERSQEQMDMANELDWQHVLANRKVRAAEFDLKWTRREHAKV